MDEMIQVRVKSIKRTCEVSVLPECTVNELLQMCKVRECMAVLFEGQRVRKEQSLHSAGIETGTLLYIVSMSSEIGKFPVRQQERKFPVRLQREGKACTLFCTKTTTITDIKQQCRDSFFLRPDSIKVLYHGTELLDSAIVADCVTEPRPVLFIEKVERRPMSEKGFSIVIKTLTGKNLSITVGDDMMISNIKELISEREGLPIESLRLICAGHCLSDEETVGQLGIREGSTLHLILRLR